MREPAVYSWRNPWLRWSVLSVVGVCVLSLGVGFVWLPSAQADFGAQSIWASICRAAGVPASWSGAQPPSQLGVRSTGVVLTEQMARPGSNEAVGRGATLALQCTVCHGARGVSGTNAPNLAGQYAEVVAKQLTDYQRGDRHSAIMQALAQNLSDLDVRDLAAYYAYLPRLANADVDASASAKNRAAVPALVSVGDPMRNIAPCAACHGGIDHKLGAPWLEGMPVDYLSDQLTAFASGQRKNDSHAQMRNMARTLSADEVAAVAAFYAGRDPALPKR